MTEIVHLQVPGLGRRFLESDPLQNWITANGVRVADLESSLPWSRASVEATLLSGRKPSAHGVLVDRDAPLVPVLHPFACRSELAFDPGEVFVHVRWDRLAEARMAADQGEVREALHELVGFLVAAQERVPRLLISGAPALTATPRSLAAYAVERGTPMGGILWMEGTPPEDEAWRALLSRPGHERILHGDALERWGAPANRGWVLVAEPGATFGTAPLDHGAATLLDPRETPVLLGWGITAAKGWPGTVHDWRVAAGIASQLGREGFDAEDPPLPL